MKRFLFALALVVALPLGLGGCSTGALQNFDTAFSLATKSITNPVTRDDLYKVESGVQIAFTALNAYKRSCAEGLVDANCRANVAAIQQYTRQLPPLLAQLRSFVKDNDQINAALVYNQVVTLVANFKTAARNVGVNVGG